MLNVPPPGGNTRMSLFCFFNITSREHLPGRGQEKTRTPHTRETWIRSTSSRSGRGGRRRRRKRRRRRRVRGGMLGPSRRRLILQKKKGRVRLPGNTQTRCSRCAIKMTGSTGRTSYELSKKLDASRYSREKCADGGEGGRRGAAKVLGIDPKTLRYRAPDPKTFYPRGDLRQKGIPRGQIQEEGGDFLFFREKKIPLGVNQRNHASRPKRCWGGGRG